MSLPTYAGKSRLNGTILEKTKEARENVAVLHFVDAFGS